MDKKDIQTVRQRYQKEKDQALDRVKQIELKLQVLADIEAETEHGNGLFTTSTTSIPADAYRTMDLTPAILDALTRLQRAKTSEIQRFLIVHGFQSKGNLANSLNTALSRLSGKSRIAVQGGRGSRVFSISAPREE